MGATVTTSFDQGRFDTASAKAVNAGLTGAALAGSGFMKRGMSTVGRYHPSSPGNPPNVRRGGLRNSITFTESTAFRSSAGSNLPYARIHEAGGVIRPRRGKFIPVPINIPAMRVQEEFGGATATEFFAGVGGGVGYISTFNGGLRRLDLHVERTKEGKLFLVGKRAKKVGWRVSGPAGRAWNLSEKAIPRWALVRQVRMPARPWCVPAVENNKAAINAYAVKRASVVFRELGFGSIR